jgi:hypothetical protein
MDQTAALPYQAHSSCIEPVCFLSVKMHHGGQLQCYSTLLPLLLERTALQVAKRSRTVDGLWCWAIKG